LGVEAELIEGGGGIYDIKVGDTLVYSKHANSNQFPETDEVVVELIKAV
jgi:predicted Rdx family selenoprotein